MTATSFLLKSERSRRLRLKVCLLMKMRGWSPEHTATRVRFPEDEEARRNKAKAEEQPAGTYAGPATDAEARKFLAHLKSLYWASSKSAVDGKFAAQCAEAFGMKIDVLLDVGDPSETWEFPIPLKTADELTGLRAAALSTWMKDEGCDPPTLADMVCDLDKKSSLYPQALEKLTDDIGRWCAGTALLTMAFVMDLSEKVSDLKDVLTLLVAFTREEVMTLEIEPLKCDGIGPDAHSATGPPDRNGTPAMQEPAEEAHMPTEARNARAPEANGATTSPPQTDIDLDDLPTLRGDALNAWMLWRKYFADKLAPLTCDSPDPDDIAKHSAMIGKWRNGKKLAPAEFLHKCAALHGDDPLTLVIAYTGEEAERMPLEDEPPADVAEVPVGTVAGTEAEAVQALVGLAMTVTGEGDEQDAKTGAPSATMANETGDTVPEFVPSTPPQRKKPGSKPGTRQPKKPEPEPVAAPETKKTAPKVKPAAAHKAKKPATPERKPQKPTKMAPIGRTIEGKREQALDVTEEGVARLLVGVERVVVVSKDVAANKAVILVRKEVSLLELINLALRDV